MTVQVQSNLQKVADLIVLYQQSLRDSLLSPNTRQKFAIEVAKFGEERLQQVTEENIDSTDRWRLSGMASKMMGGVDHTADLAWKTSEVTPDKVTWQNGNPIYKFLDLGTRDHGPVRAKKLFIPLNQATALAYLNGTLIWGDGIDGMVTPYEEESKQWYKDAQYGDKNFGKYKRRKIKKGGTRKLIYGKDYVLKEHVKGINARFITKQFLENFGELLKVIFKEGRERFNAEVRSQGWIQQGGQQ
jgi:hypothetical protein